MLRKIMVCQNTGCQQRGGKNVLHYLESIYKEKYRSAYPSLKIETGDCMGDCELGPIVKINDAVTLRRMEKEQIEQLLQNPQLLLGEVMHVLEQDRETFERIIKGALF